MIFCVVEKSSGQRQPWDFNTFLKTVVFFNKPPSLGEIVTNIAKQPLSVLKAVTGSETEVLAFAERTPQYNPVLIESCKRSCVCIDA